MALGYVEPPPPVSEKAGKGNLSERFKVLKDDMQRLYQRLKEIKASNLVDTANQPERPKTEQN